MPCAPVSSTQRTLSSRSSATTAAAIPSRIAWSSALRLAGLEIVRRRTPSAGSSWRSCPGLRGGTLRGAQLLEHRQHRPLVGGADDQRPLDALGVALAGPDRLEVALELGE